MGRFSFAELQPTCFRNIFPNRYKKLNLNHFPPRLEDSLAASEESRGVASGQVQGNLKSGARSSPDELLDLMPGARK
jgi:hypothetical protein